MLSTISFVSIVFGQELKFKSEFETLTWEIISLEELQSKLLTTAFENSNSIFIQADTNFIELGQEISSRESSPHYFIWHCKTLFFYNIDFWLRPINVTIDQKKATYEFVTCSWFEQPRDYFEGIVSFIFKNGKWKITNKKIKKVKKPCLTCN